MSKAVCHGNPELGNWLKESWRKPMTSYVCGFLFSEERDRVALIQKDHPEWQRGHWNGIGGKIEAGLGEGPLKAMTREFLEETGVLVDEGRWDHVVTIAGPDWTVGFYKAFGPEIDQVITNEAERVTVHYVTELPQLCVPNLFWLIPLALDDQMKSLGYHRVKEHP